DLPDPPDPPDPPDLPDLNDVSFAGDRTGGETLRGKRRQIEPWIASGNHVGEQPARSRRVLKAVPAEAIDPKQPLQTRRGSDDRVAIGRHLVEARPRMRDRRVAQRWQPLYGHVDHLRKKVPLHRGLKRRRLAALAHAEQQAGALAMKIKRRLEV